MCISKIQVEVNVTHACASQLRISLLGPGLNSYNFESQTSSFEVMMFNQRQSPGLGCLDGSQHFVFDDKAERLTYDFYESFDGLYKPEGVHTLVSSFVNSHMQFFLNRTLVSLYWLTSGCKLDLGSRGYEG